MNDEEKRTLAATVAREMDLCKPSEIKPWLAGFVATHPRKLVEEVNLIAAGDPLFRAAVQRTSGWLANHPRVSWSHVTPETEASLRDAASWLSAPLSARTDWEKGGTTSWLRSDYFKRLRIPERAAECRQASILWGDRVTTNRSGVALFVGGLGPWPGEVAGVVAEVARRLEVKPIDKRWIALRDDGWVLEGLPTWPR